MNLLLLVENDFINTHEVVLNDRRAQHICAILKAQVNDQIDTGIVNGNIGTSTITFIDATINSSKNKLPTVHLRLDREHFKEKPPTALDIQLLLALPRPNMLRRTLRHITELGVKHIHLFHSAKVEKSFWQTPLLTQERIQEELILGLEQSCDTYLPNVHLYPDPKLFLTTQLATLSHNTQKLLAHPYQAEPCPVNVTQKTSLLIGPEGGFTRQEIAAFQELGFKLVHIGTRILRVENAVTALVSRVASWS